MGRKVLLTHNGQTLSLSAWARELGVRPGTLVNRLHSGCPPARALSMPLQSQTQGGVMQWCQTHEQALVRDIQGKTLWHPLPGHLLAYAMKVAAACGCAHLLSITHVPCPQCQGKEEAA